MFFDFDALEKYYDEIDECADGEPAEEERRERRGEIRETAAQGPLDLPDAQGGLPGRAEKTQLPMKHLMLGRAEKTQPLHVLILGSSVAQGSAAAPGHSWASKLQTELAVRGHQLTNAAVGGLNTFATLEFLDAVVAAVKKPDIIIVSLSLANEGLFWASDPGELCEQYVQNMAAMVAKIRERGAKPVLGGVYPNDSCMPFHEKYLFGMDKRLEALGAEVINFFSTTHGKGGHWHGRAAADAGHPNNVGHDMMFRAIDVDRLLRLEK